MALTAVWGRAAGPTLHARLCAVVTAGSCALHVWLAAAGRHSGWLSALMIAMVVACLPCTVHIWRQVRVGALQRVMVSALAMAVLHAFVLLAAGPSGHGHAGLSGAGPTAGIGDPAAAVMLGVVAVELTTALLAATLVARLRPRAFARSSGTLLQ
ncbi:hypothetical protein [Arthrobacter sp. PAMC25284]|uniref:hypothetical protein n=1 Tax=Arthrobacter sp. PAMC25284 TaxID=2861279 RepID=UPI001C63A432|nr:hypothetical protein [Arthrobacter sp. PAMC25284]QYF90373.1 hypothetical protein KY499_03350 [Arthrobacter sp. PAMC25284]